jgi:hypothetical protein
VFVAFGTIPIGGLLIVVIVMVRDWAVSGGASASTDDLAVDEDLNKAAACAVKAARPKAFSQVRDRLRGGLLLESCLDR